MHFKTKTGTLADSGCVTAMTISDAGNVGIGTVTPEAALEIARDGAKAQLNLSAYDDSNSYYPKIVMRKADGTEADPDLVHDNDILGVINFEGGDNDADDVYLPGAQIIARVNGTPADNAMPCDLEFWTNTGSTGCTQNMTILESGNVGIGDDSPDYKLDVEIADGNNNIFVANFENLDTSDPEGIRIKFAADFTSASITDDRAILYSDSNSDNFIVYSDGGVHADEADHVSDIRLKENIVDATPKLDDINKLKVRNFNFKPKDSVEAKRIGFIADEVETVFPGIIKKRAIKKFGVDYTDLKSIRYEPIVAMLVKAIQELSAKVTALENA